MALNAFSDINGPEIHSFRQRQLLCVALCPSGGSEAGHGYGNYALSVQSQHVEGPYSNQ